MRLAYNQVHELVEALRCVHVSIVHCWRRGAPAGKGPTTYADGAGDADAELLVEPDLDGRVLLQQAEEEVDWGEEHTATAATASAGHFRGVWEGCRGSPC